MSATPHNGYIALTTHDEAIGDDSNVYGTEETVSEPRAGGCTRPCRSMFSRVKAIIDSNTGLLLVMASQAFLSLMNVAVKKLNSLDEPVSALELVIVRMVITYICCMVYMLTRKVEDPWIGPKGVRLLLISRGFFGFFGLFGIYYSLQYLSLSDATVLTFLSPMTTAMAGSLLLGENFTRKEAFAGIFSLLGVVLIARPQFLFGSISASASSAVNGASPGISEKGTPAERLVAVGVALLGVLGATGAYISIRAIGQRAHPMHSMTSFSVQCVLIATTGMIITKSPVVIPHKLEWVGMLLMIGFFGFMAQVLLTMGLQREAAGRGTIAIYTQVVFAGILERIFLHTIPSVLSIIGTLIIIASALYIALTKESAFVKGSKPVEMAQLSEDSAMEQGLLHNMEGIIEDSQTQLGLSTKPSSTSEQGMINTQSNGMR